MESTAIQQHFKNDEPGYIGIIQYVRKIERAKFHNRSMQNLGLIAEGYTGFIFNELDNLHPLWGEKAIEVTPHDLGNIIVECKLNRRLGPLYKPTVNEFFNYYSINVTQALADEIVSHIPEAKRNIKNTI
jgi:hypothetical protein